MKYSEAIHQARDDAKLSQAELADRLGWKQSRVSNYERGTREPKQSDLELISKALGEDKNHVLRIAVGMSDRVQGRASVCSEQMSDVVSRIHSLANNNGIPERGIKASLSSICGISYHVVAGWYNGNTKQITPEHLLRIADYFDTTVDYLLRGNQASTPENQSATNLGERIAQRIASLNVTQQDVADLLNIRQVAVHNLVNDKALKPSYMVELASALECSPEWLAYGGNASMERNMDNSLISVRSKKALDWISGAVMEKRLSEEDILMLQAIAQRIAK